VNEDESLESVVVAGVTSDKNEAKITLRRLPGTAGKTATLFRGLADAKISVDMIVQNASADGTLDLTFTVAKGELEAAANVARATFPDLEMSLQKDVVKVSIVGLGMRSHAGVAATMFELLGREGISVEAVSTSEIKVSCLIPSKYHELAVRALHDGFGLNE
jgi:aspartate kinase